MNHATMLSESNLLSHICQTQRDQPYRFIHKALRTLLTQTLVTAGKLDADDAQDRLQLVEEIETVLGVCSDHLAHENRFFNEPLRQVAPRAVMPFLNDHEGHLESISQLRLRLQQVRDAGTQAPALAYQLYLEYSDFVGENLAHMLEEESTLTQALWNHFSDEQLQTFTHALESTLSPEEKGFYLRWMARGLNVTELVMLLKGAQAAVPKPVFQELAMLVAQETGPHRWGRIARLLGIDPVPGLVEHP